MTTKKNLRFDPFVEAVRRDPKAADELTLLQGYLGKSSVDGHVRVYFDEELNNFVEVPESDILYSAPNEKTENALGGSRLWVKKSTVVTFGDPNLTNRPQSSFLEGDLINAYRNLGIGGQGFDPGGIPGEFGIPNTWTPTCRSVGNGACITNNPPCQATRIGCNFPTLIQRTCNRTCFVTQFRTCASPTCFNTCLSPTCFRTCRPVACTVHTTPGCPIRTFACTFRPEDIVQGVVNPGDFTGGGGFDPGYAGAFNPYNLGY